MRKTILDLCGGSGAWSAPYVAAGYDVRLIDLPTDVRLLEPQGKVHGILAAPPCTMFCRMRMCRGRPTDTQFTEALSVVDACLRVILQSSPAWWALENPQGYLKTWLGEPVYAFQPWHFGDPWTKRTWLWGRFTKPTRRPIPHAGRSWVKHHTPEGQRGGAKTTAERCQTPAGFAHAFYEANP